MPSPLRLGIDLGGTKIEAQLLRQRETHWRLRMATPRGDYRATLQAIVHVVQEARSAAHAEPITIGLGTPGSLTPDGLVKNANSTCLNGQALQRDLESMLRQPVRLANDANCLALSEATDGAGEGKDVVFAAILGTGVGAGITVRHQLLTGPNGLAGEWGHNPLPWPEMVEQPGPACYCGRHGCMETWLSGPAMARDHPSSLGGALSNGLTAEDIARQALAGHADGEATLHRHAQRLARALASVINVLDPDVIVLGGGLSRMPQLYTLVPALWSAWVFSGGHQDIVRTQLKPALHGDASGARGAAWLWNDPVTSA